MFTGIIKSIGRIARIEKHGSDARLRIETPGLDPLAWAQGASVAVNGVCLTAVSLDSDGFEADVSEHTLQVTTFGGLHVDAAVNLEPALRLGDPLDGHWVTGHVDAAATVASIADDAGSWRLRFVVPDDLRRYLARKGSVAVDGVSLTVNSVAGDSFEVTIIPHTQTATIIQHYKVGTAVNIEVDIVARYMERLVLQSN
jgi:riboflavin synthase